MSDELEKKESQTVDKTVDVLPAPISGDCKPRDEPLKLKSVEEKIHPPAESDGVEEPMKTMATEKVNNGDSVEVEKKINEKPSSEKVTNDNEQKDISMAPKSKSVETKDPESLKIKTDIKEDSKPAVAEKEIVKDESPQKSKTVKDESPQKSKIVKDESPQKSKIEVKEKENHHQGESESTTVCDDPKNKETSPKAAKEKKVVLKTPEKSSEDSDQEEMETEVLKPGILEQPVIQTGKRERRKVERLSTTYTPPADKPLDIPEGRGMKLGDCPRVEHFLSKTAVEDLKPLHRFIYGRIGKESLLKKNLKLFNGFAFAMDSVDYKKKRATLMKYTMATLKPICGALDLEKKGTRENIVDRVLSFLVEPTDSGQKLPEPKKKRKRSSASDSEKPKRKRVKKVQEPTDGDDDGDKDKSDEEKDDDASESDGKSDESNDEEMKSDDEPPEVKKKSTPKKKSEPKKKPEPKKAAKKEPKKKKETTTSKKKGSSAPTDDDIKATVKEILEGANLEEVTMKTVCKQVYEKYPTHDLIDRKDFIKSMVRALIS